MLLQHVNRKQHMERPIAQSDRPCVTLTDQTTQKLNGKASVGYTFTSGVLHYYDSLNFILGRLWARVHFCWSGGLFCCPSCLSCQIIKSSACLFRVAGACNLDFYWLPCMNLLALLLCISQLNTKYLYSLVCQYWSHWVYREVYALHRGCLTQT